MSEKLKPREDSPENPERRKFFGICRDAMLTATGVALGVSGCATTGQNSESQAVKVENKKPEWVDGPEVFEKDGYIYAVGKNEETTSIPESIPEGARLKARELLCQSILPETSKKISGCAVLERDVPEDHGGYLTGPNNGSYTYYVLMRVKKPESSEIENNRPDWVDGPKIFEDNWNNYYTVGSDPVIDIPPADDRADLYAARARAVWNASDDFQLVFPGHRFEPKNEGEGFLTKILNGSESFSYSIVDTHLEKRDDGEDVMHVLIKIR